MGWFNMEYGLWPALLAVAVTLLTYYYTKVYWHFKKHGIPYKSPFPFLGNSWQALFRMKSFAHIIQDSYKIDSDAKYTGFYDLMTPAVMIREPELIKQVAVKNFESFPDHRGFVDEVVEPLFGKNLFTLRGDRWREIRQIISPTFTSSKMKAMFILMQECAVYFTDYIAKRPAEERVTDIKDAFTRYTNDVIATCAFGISINSMLDRKNHFFVYGREATQFGFVSTIKFFFLRSCPSLARLFKVRLVRKQIADFFKEIVADTIKARDEKGFTRPDMIQLMMETRGKLGPGRELTIEDMTAQAFIFFFGGFESTSTLMCFVGHELMVNPDVQEKLQIEIDEVLEKTNGQPTYEAVNEMKYLDAVVNEALRMYPIAVAADRICIKDYELPPTLPDREPYTVKPGDFIWLPIYALHRDPKYFPDPDTFNPDRFINDGKAIANSGAYFPFGLGPRMCIGNRFALLETKILLFHMLARCNLRPCAKTTIPLVINRKGLAMTAENGFWSKVEPREKPHASILNAKSVAVNGTAK